MHQGRFSGPISVLDPASNQRVDGSVMGTFVFVTGGDPAQVEPQLRDGLLRALTDVIGQKLAAQQVALPTIQGSLPYFMPEVIARAGAERFGAQLQSVEATVNLASPTAVAAYAGALPPDPIEATRRAFEQRAAEKLDPRNYEYGAQVNVGGFKIKASTDGGLDTAGLQNQLKNKVKTEIIWYAMGCVIVGLVVIGLGVLGWYVYSQYQKGAALGRSLEKSGSGAGVTAPVGEAKAATWDGKSAFTCGGSDNLKLDGVTAELKSGTAITAAGNCHLTLTNVTIRSPNGISALANAVVTMTGGSIDSSGTAAKALGNAQITFSGTTVKGKQTALGAAKITGP